MWVYERPSDKLTFGPDITLTETNEVVQKLSSFSSFLSGEEMPGFRSRRLGNIHGEEGKLI